MYPYKHIKYNHLIRCNDKFQKHMEIFIRLKVNDSIEKASIVCIKVSGFWESPRFVSIYAIIIVNRKLYLKLHTIYKIQSWFIAIYVYFPQNWHFDIFSSYTSRMFHGSASYTQTTLLRTFLFNSCWFPPHLNICCKVNNLLYILNIILGDCRIFTN